MTRAYFADAWFFIALLDRFDPHHAAASRLDRWQHGDAALVTHDAVFNEVLAHFADEGARARAAAAFAVRQALDLHTVVASTRALFSAGLDLYARRPDKEYSLVDCMSMALMRERGITHVLTNDHHFAQEGFVVMNDAP